MIMVKGRTKIPDGLKPQKETSIPDCPEYLDTIGKDEWKRITAEMLSVGLLHKVDRASLELYCQTYSRYRIYSEQLQNEKSIILMDNGAQQINPTIKLADNALKTCRLMLIQFGLTPTAREKLTIKNSTVNESANKWKGMIR